MIYIITNSFNPIVCSVIDWLRYYKVPFCRINDFIKDSDKIKIDFDVNDKQTLNKETIWLSKVKTSSLTTNHDEINNQLFFEYYQGFFKVINKEKVLGQILNLSDKCKFNVLLDAKSVGLKVPDTIITNNKKNLLLFYAKHPMIITKSSHDVFNAKIANKTYRPYTNIISEIELINDNFGISMFQEYIDKECDIKAFYLNGKFFSQAIFSQAQKETMIDFRIYNKNIINRVVPFKLPINIEKSTRKLLMSYSLKIAVVDFILDKKNQLFFLEVNPDGIYDDISNSCNYYIEKQIAEYLYEQK